MPNNPGQPLAPHVQAAIAKGQGMGVQPKTRETLSEAAQGHPMAAHVRNAIGDMYLQAAGVAPRAPQTVILMTPCPECGKNKGHKSDCSRHKHNRGVVRQEAQEQHRENQSWTNLQDYRSGWVKRNDITEQDVKEFLKTYDPGKIRGHASGDNSQGEQGNTTTDLNAFKSWYTKKYGWRG